MWNAISLVQDLNSCRRVHFYDDNHYTTGTTKEICIKGQNKFPVACLNGDLTL